MAREPMIFVNLPVADLEASKRFLEAIGATNEPKFTDETAAMMRFSEAINVMLLTKDKFAGFTPRAIADATQASEVLIALSADSRDAVDRIVDAAVGAGGTADPGPKQDYGVMY
ncbi:MAG TPA: lactoylglutathione lyase, partial [Sphingomicrobium sp.]|nr:lactoylglutathione lyase [Sphingomicrobium sp.]